MCIRTSESITKITQSLLKVQKQIKFAVIDTDNAYYKSRYASLGSVVDACKEALNNNGIVFIQGASSNKDLPRMVCVTTRLLHESGEYIEDTIGVPYVQDTPQAYGSSLTYARRYALSALLGIVSDEDDDGNAGSGLEPKTPQKPQAKKPTKIEKQKILGNLAVKAGCKSSDDFKTLMTGLINRPVTKSSEMDDSELDFAIGELEKE